MGMTEHFRESLTENSESWKRFCDEQSETWQRRLRENSDDWKAYVIRQAASHRVFSWIVFFIGFALGIIFGIIGSP